jgi:imidazoleglycerol-phosphate dehydratase
MARRGEVERVTGETTVRVVLDLDGTGRAQAATGVPFLDHMLILAASHGRFDLEVAAAGDLAVDGHHSVEDVGLTLGQALSLALGEKRGINRYGTSHVPMDEALARCVLDLSGRPHLSFRAELAQERVGGFETGLAREFFQALANEARLTLHLDAWHGLSAHHVLEALFKAFGRALGEAMAVRPGAADIPSTKGVL